MASFVFLEANDVNSSGSFPSDDYIFLPEKEAHSLNEGSIDIEYNFPNLQSTMNEKTLDQNAVNAQCTKLISNTLAMAETLNETNSIMKDLPGLMASKVQQLEKNLQAVAEKNSFLEKENANLSLKLDYFLKEDFNPEDIKNCEKLEEIINEKDDKIEELQAKSANSEKAYLESIHDLTSKLFESEKQNHESNAVIQELKIKLSEVEKHAEIIPNLQAQIEELQTAKDKTEKAYVERIDNLTTQFYESEKQNNESNGVVQELKIKLSEVEKNAEVIPILQAQIEELQTTKDKTEKAYVERIDNLTTQLYESEKQNNESNGVVQELKIKLFEVEKNAEIIPILQAQDQKNCEKFEGIIKQKDDELDSLKKEKEHLSHTLNTCNITKMQELNALKTEFQLITDKLNNKSTVAELYRERCESLQQQLKENQVKAKTSEHDYQLKIQNLLKKSDLEQQVHENVKNELSKVLLKFEKLQVDYDRLSSNSEMKSRLANEKIKGLQATNASTEKAHLEEIDHLTAELFQSEEKLKETNVVVKQCKRKLSEREKKIEIIEVEQAKNRDALHDALKEVTRLTEKLKEYEEKSKAVRVTPQPSTITFGCKKKESMYRW